MTLAVEKLHPDVGSVIELGGQDAKIVLFREEVREDGKVEKTAFTSMNDKCASGTGATIDKCLDQGGDDAPIRCRRSRFDPQPAAPRGGEVRGVRGDGHRQPRQVRHRGRRRSSTRSPTPSCTRTSRCSPAATPCGTRSCCSAAPTPTCRSSSSAGGCASPRRGRRGATRCPRCRSRSWCSCRTTRSTTRRSGRWSSACRTSSEVRRRPTGGWSGLNDYIKQRPIGAARRRTAGGPLVKRPGRARRRSSRELHRPRVRARRTIQLRRQTVQAASIGLDGGLHLVEGGARRL